MLQDTWQCIKTHGRVSCNPRKRGARKWSEHIDRNNKAMIRSSVMPYPNYTKFHNGVSINVG